MKKVGVFEKISENIITQKEPHCKNEAFLLTSLPDIGNADSFAFPRGEVMPMFVTWEMLFLFAGCVISLLAYVDNHNKKN